MRTSCLAMFALSLLLMPGCDAPEVVTPVTMANPSDQKPTTESEKSRVPDTRVEHPEWYLADGRIDMSGVAGEPAMTTATPREITAKDPKKGKLTRKKGGKLLGTTLQALPWAESETYFNILIPSQLATYDALKGRPVQSHKEFMDDFVNGFMQEHQPGFRLPDLEPGDAYLYDADDKKLKIFRPGEAGAPQVEGVVAYEAEP
ncbi:MAG: hypothetical protein AAGD11_04880 [Planctomycetota bacterium]